MSPEQKEAFDIIAKLVKAAIGESNIYINSYEVDWNRGVECGDPEAKVTVQGDVHGTLMLTPAVTRKVNQMVRAHQTAESLREARAELEAEKRKNKELVEESRKRIEDLKGRLARLHALSDPDRPGTDYEL